MAWDIVKEAVYDHPPERVWRALTEREALAAWLMRNDFEPRKGHRFTFNADPVPGWEGVTECEVLEIDAPRRLVLGWWGRGKNPRTTVTWTLEPLDGGRRTRLRLEHRGLVGVRGLAMKVSMGGGWGGMLREGIPRVLDHWKAGRTEPLAPAHG